jgi:putative tryptophan/tyrosine transport system substrate-binding protein
MAIGRRQFISALGGATFTWPFSARAQQPDRIRRIGIMMQLAESDQAGQDRIAAFRDELQKLGWSIGKNLQIDYRWDTSNDELARAAVAELLNLAPDVIFANSSVALRAAQQATRAVPIVFTTVIDPVGQGFVASLAHPGGNTTGFSYLEPSVGGKWLDLLREIAPRVTHVACIFNPQRGPYSVAISRFAEEAAQRLSVQYIAAPLHESPEIETVMSTLAHEPGGGLIVSPDAFTVTHGHNIIDMAARYGLPSIYAERNFAAAGGLISYGADYVDHFRQAANYVDRILRGAKPTDLPVQQPSKFYLVVNLKTAKALGLTVSTSMQLLADEVIE